MNFDSRITWEKLSLEIDLLTAEEPNSLVPLLIGLNALIWPNDPQEWSYRTLNFMTYELMAQAESYSESDRVHILNDYFFDQKGFQILPLNSSGDESTLLMGPVLSKRTGLSTPIALLYLHLATHLDLPLYPVRLRNMTILKWIRGGKSSYLDVANAGRVLKSSHIIRILNEKNKSNRNEFETNCTDILPSKLIFSQYLNQLIEMYQKQEKSKELLLVFDVLLRLEPSHLGTLADRALLRQRLGYAKEALLDIKRYFSFVDQNQAPNEIQIAYRQLQSFGELESISRTDILH